MTGWFFSSSLIAAGAALVAMYVCLVRPWCQRWGATTEEASGPLPGDDLVPDPRTEATHAVTVNARPEVVWPWLVQLGQDRAGFYSYTWLENLFGCHMRNTYRVVPEWQHLATGDGILFHPKLPRVPVADLEPNRFLVLGGLLDPRTGLPAAAGADTAACGATGWASVLRDDGEGRTRLLARLRGRWPRGLRGWLANRLFWEPAHFVMERRMLLTIKRLAEAQGGRGVSTITGSTKTPHLLTYFALTFAISWGGALLVVGPSGIPGTPERFEALLPLVVLAMLAGPSIAGVLSTGLAHGRPGLRELLSRSLRWRVGARWYAIALLTAPLLVAAVLFALSLTSPAFHPGIVTTSQPAAHFLLGIATGLAAGMFEELGWTGFAVPGLRQYYGVLATGLIVGLLWGAWHFLVVWWGSSSSSGALPMAVYMPVWLFSFLPPYRVLMVWVYDRTGSLLAAMLMHASLTASVRIFDPLAISGAPLLTYNLALAAALWVAVVAVAVANRGQFERSRLSQTG